MQTSTTAPRAGAAYRPLSGAQTDYAFQTGVTYFLSETVILRGTTTFQPGCILKYDDNVSLFIGGPVICNGTVSNPSILTSKNDRWYGQSVVTSYVCPAYTAKHAIKVIGREPVILSGMKVRWAQTAFEFSNQGGGKVNMISDCLVEWCGTGAHNIQPIGTPPSSLSIRNSSAVGVDNPVVMDPGSGTLSGAFSFPASLSNDIITEAVGLANTGNEVFANDMRTEYNKNCILYGVKGLSSCSTANSPAPIWNQGAGTLISPSHALTVGHMAPNATDRTYTFLGKSNTPYSRKCLDKAVFGNPNTDLCVLLFDPLPPDVEWVKVLPKTVYNKVPRLLADSSSAECPLFPAFSLVAQKYRRNLNIEDILRGTPDLHWEQRHPSHWFPNWPFTPFEAGDCGSPFYLLIKGELVLFDMIDGPWPAHDATGQPVTYLPGVDPTEVNAAMARLSQAHDLPIYQVTLMDIGEFLDE